MDCKHCGQETNASFCCNGCAVAYAIINSLDLTKYYEFCKTIYNKTPMKVYEIQNELDYQSYVIPTEHGFRINLIVEGIHCGSCVWLIENALKKHPGVISARVNLSTRRLVLEWDGKEVNTLVSVVEKLGYKLIPFTPDASLAENKSREHELLKCLFVAGFGSIAIMMITFGIWIANLNHEITTYFRDILHWIGILITVPATLYAGRPFFRSAWGTLKARRSNMDVPISLATILAIIISMQEVLRSSEYIYLDAAVSLVFFLLIGRYLDLKMRNRAREYAQNLILSQAQSVTLDQDGKLRLTNIKNAKEGDVVFIAAGEKIPVDGMVIEGQSEVDNSLITGETIPVAIKEKCFVHAGTVNLNQPIRVQITRLGENTILAEIIRLMETAEQGKAKFVKLADKIASMYTPFVLSLSCVTLIFWLLAGRGWADALLYAVSVMIITCPCALGLAVPAVQVIATGRLLAQGIIVKTADAMERLAQINYVVFDKTGTLTEGMPKLINPESLTKSQKEVISALAAQSKHPLSQAIVRELGNSPLTIVAQEKKGFGMEAGKYKLGNRDFCNITDFIGKAHNENQQMEVWFSEVGSPAICLKFYDEIKEDAKEIVDWLKYSGVEVEILSGDRKQTVKKVASELGIDNIFAEYKPKEKYSHIEDLQIKGNKALVVGDGLNDSAALKLAYASMSPASALEITQTSADIVFQGNKLWPVKEAIIVAKKSISLVKQNFMLSFLYNILTIPFAMLGYATPAMAAIIMSTSSILVVANAMRLMLNNSVTQSQN